MTTETAPCAVAIDELSAFAVEAYTRVGLSPADAATMAEVQLDADVRGVTTHGLQRLPWYVGRLRSGENNPTPAYGLSRSAEWSVLLDADNALGQLACVTLVDDLIATAQRTGFAVGATVNSNDWGCGAYYPLRAASAGLICFATTTSVPFLAPYGSSTRMFGNNPMAYAAPRRQAPPIVLDMALTPVALGKVVRAIAEDRRIPADWGFRDVSGEPTTDPRVAIDGIIPAIGGYKGIGLSLIMNVLAGILPGGAHSGAVDVGRRGQFFVVISPSVFVSAERYYDGVEEMVAAFYDAAPVPGFDGVYLPGELEQRAADAAMARGEVHYPRSLLADLAELASELGIAAPAAVDALTGTGEPR